MQVPSYPDSSTPPFLKYDVEIVKNDVRCCSNAVEMLS